MGLLRFVGDWFWREQWEFRSSFRLGPCRINDAARSDYVFWKGNVGF